MKIHRIESLEEYESFAEATKVSYSKHLQFLHSLLPAENKEFIVTGYSYTAGSQVDFFNDFTASPGFPTVNWRERVVCPVTRLNNRTRAAIHIFDIFSNAHYSDPIFVMEQTTPLYKYLKGRYSELVGSEYLGVSIPFGESNDRGIRNEDATRLSFSGASLAAILSLDVFEHIYDYKSAFRECFRVLESHGCLIFTVPFNVRAEQNLERAVVLESGEIEHLLPAQYHGNPLSKKGVLCFRHYGWHMLTDLKEVGFSEAFAMIFNSESFGYLTNQLIFCCRK